MSAVKKLTLKIVYPGSRKFVLVSSHKIYSKDISKLNISRLYDLYNETGENKYFDEMFDRLYSFREENEPTRQKIYRHLRRKRNY